MPVISDGAQPGSNHLVKMGLIDRLNGGRRDYVPVPPTVGFGLRLVQPVIATKTTERRQYIMPTLRGF